MPTLPTRAAQPVMKGTSQVQLAPETSAKHSLGKLSSTVDSRKGSLRKHHFHLKKARQTLLTSITRTRSSISLMGTRTLCNSIKISSPTLSAHQPQISQPWMFQAANVPRWLKSSSTMVFERSCDALNALAGVLHKHYIRRGFQMVNKNNAIQEPFRRGLGFAVQWYDLLLVEVEQNSEATLQQSRDKILASKVSTIPASPLPNSEEPSMVMSSIHLPSGNTSLIPGNCSPLLVQHCPACFGATAFGRPLAKGGDIHVATDGNFHHRHRRSAGDSLSRLQMYQMNILTSSPGPPVKSRAQRKMVVGYCG
ncbi:hypothetical protein JVT61DRAFT_11372 [Boletus reticuloceps]|uniref:Uncharacterized protein n=1 Tax=Boletus reticuloceps TaxID=495285 RepID=A0A8I3A487_9AGAM|nr:hypothetical protein JVT61DRAFT_11372 [Boletus reticuloceps]